VEMKAYILLRRQHFLATTGASTLNIRYQDTQAGAGTVTRPMRKPLYENQSIIETEKTPRGVAHG